jgi:hypothetical protein
VADSTTNGNGNGYSRGPWWAQLIQTVGVTASIAIFLVWMMAGQITPMLEHMDSFMASDSQQMSDLEKHEQDDAVQRAKQWDLIGQMQESEHKDREAQLALEQQTCINVAKSAYQVQKCQEMRDAGEASR